MGITHVLRKTIIIALISILLQSLLLISCSEAALDKKICTEIANIIISEKYELYSDPGQVCGVTNQKRQRRREQ